MCSDTGMCRGGPTPTQRALSACRIEQLQSMVGVDGVRAIGLQAMGPELGVFLEAAMAVLREIAPLFGYHDLAALQDGQSARVDGVHIKMEGA